MVLGVIIISLAVGHGVSEFAGWMVLGGGLIFAGLWDALRGSPKYVRVRFSSEDKE